MTAAEFLRDAHRNSHYGETMLRRWARHRNDSRRRTEPPITVAVLEAAIALEKSDPDEILGVCV